jgi:hypothetical protein
MDVTLADDAERDDVLEFTIQTKAQVEADGQGTFSIKGKKARSNIPECTIVSTLEMMSSDGW